MRHILAGLMLALSVGSATAQSLPGTPADPGSPQALVGEAILYFVDGRTREQAGNDAFNPFGIDPDAVLYHVGAFFIADFDGEALKEGELALYPQFRMPRDSGTPSAATPPAISFALVQGGTCHAGYVAGFPVPDMVYSLDLAGGLCHADTVEQVLADDYAQREAPMTVTTVPGPAAPGDFNPAFPLDSDLQSAVYAAYDAAYAAAMASPDYLFWDGNDFAPLRRSIADALAGQGLGAITVLHDPLESPVMVPGCAVSGTSELRVAFTADGSGVAIAAASSERSYGYSYDLSISPDLLVNGPRPRATSGPGRSATRSQ